MDYEDLACREKDSWEEWGKIMFLGFFPVRLIIQSGSGQLPPCKSSLLHKFSKLTQVKVSTLAKLNAIDSEQKLPLPRTCID